MNDYSKIRPLIAGPTAGEAMASVCVEATLASVLSMLNKLDDPHGRPAEAVLLQTLLLQCAAAVVQIEQRERENAEGLGGRMLFFMHDAIDCFRKEEPLPPDPFMDLEQALRDALGPRRDPPSEN